MGNLKHRFKFPRAIHTSFMALTNPIVAFQTGSRASANSGATGTNTAPIVSSLYSQGRLRSPTITQIGFATGTLAFGASVTIDLSALTGLDGSTSIALVKLVYIDVGIPSTSAGGYLRIGNAASNANQLWFGGDTNTADIFPGGPMFQQGNPSSYVVVDASNKNVKILNPHGSLACDYVVRAAGLLV